MKLKFAFAAFIIGTLTASAVANAVTVWKRTDITMRTLIDYEFDIIYTNFFVMDAANQTVEVIYLRKGDRVFRCFTHEPQGQEAKHWCEDLQ